jgi:hypothetical protein
VIDASSRADDTGVGERVLGELTAPRRVLLGLTVACALVVALAATGVASADEGGTTIATAPTLVFGQPQDGIGGANIGNMFTGGHNFWRLQVFAGDAITGAGSVASANGCGTNQVALYDPSVTDATLPQSTAVFHSGGLFQGSCSSLRFGWTWTHVPFTGLGTLWMGISSEAPTFTFTARVSHRTAVRLASVPRRVASPRTKVKLRASVTSAAGKPAGVCAFDRRARGQRAWRHVRRIVLSVTGSCTSRVTPGAAGSIQFRVRFVPDPGWLSSSATTRRVRVG